jgi:hypothetical protein
MEYKFILHKVLVRQCPPLGLPFEAKHFQVIDHESQFLFVLKYFRNELISNSHPLFLFRFEALLHLFLELNKEDLTNIKLESVTQNLPLFSFSSFSSFISFTTKIYEFKISYLEFLISL